MAAAGPRAVMAEAGWPHLLRPPQGGRVDRCAGAHARRDERMTSAADRVIPFRWKRDGDGWRLFVERRQFGRLVPDKEHPGMWRCVMPNGRVSDLANLSWARRAVMESAARELEWERRQL